MCRLATTRLPASPRSVPAARGFLREHLRTWSAEQVRDDAELVLSELVTNAVLHGRPPVEVSVALVGDLLELVVVDASDGLPETRLQRHDLLADLDATLLLEAEAGVRLAERDPRLAVGASGPVAAGRGLQLVTELAATWGATPQDPGKAVWARLAVEDWLRGGSCTCSTAAAALLPSGTPVVSREA
ncbi:MAG: hypothetical protein JWM64_2525 [Frankiales bacterium]|nr:hypothetical protein [Frankiales bacterium]